MEQKDAKNNEKKTGNVPKLSSKLMVWLPLFIIWLWLWQAVLDPTGISVVPYSDFKQRLSQNEIAEVAITDTDISGIIVPGGVGDTIPKVTRTSKPWYSALLPPQFQPQVETDSTVGDDPDKPAEAKPFYFRTVRIEDPKLTEELTAKNVKFTAVKPSMLSQILWSWILPFLLIFFLWTWLARRFTNVGASVLSIGKNRAKLHVDKSTGVTFEDVAGCDEAKHELKEVVDFLKSPDKYKALGAVIPKGVLLVGPPGTGKTLLARAVAGEADVPFYSISGSDFVEMFVGVGAARVRDLFADAKKQSPCIVFIDEIDTIGRHRAVHAGVTNDEREQTLNQLLSEMDGFEPNQGVIVLAATNRPEILDHALLRPGRFDRQVLIDAPDKQGRIAVLKVHAKNKPLAKDVDLAKIAQSTPGFSGADLANTLNEAALLATRRNHHEITQSDLSEAVEKIVAGPERKSRRLDEHERKRVAFHEVGHALVAQYCKNADPVRKISIVPRGRAALGYTLQLPETERFLFTKSALLDRIRGLMGGRAGEEIVFGEISTGAENDLEKATALAQQMVCFYGMGNVGLTHYGERRPLYIGAETDTLAKNCSPETARRIDEEVEHILAQGYKDAKEILVNHRQELEIIAEELLVRESIEEHDLKTLIAKIQDENNQRGNEQVESISALPKPEPNSSADLRIH